MTDRNEEIAQVSQALSDYLHLNGLRSTTERFALLEAIYLKGTMFSPEELLTEMSERQNLRVSRATVYNNLQLFESAGLVQKVLLNGKTCYDRSWHNNCCIRLVCTKCSNVTECQDAKVDAQVKEIRMKRFTMAGYSLYVYGVCSRCAAAMKRKMKKKNKK